MDFGFLANILKFGIDFKFRLIFQILALISACRNNSDFGFRISDFRFLPNQFQGHLYLHTIMFHPKIVQKPKK
jgi:hypothetical protein